MYKPHSVDLRAINDASVFQPVLPLFEKPSKKGSSDKEKEAEKKSTSAVIPVDFVAPFAQEQTRSLAEKFKELAASFPTSNDKLITLPEAK